MVDGEPEDTGEPGPEGEGSGETPTAQAAKPFQRPDPIMCRRPEEVKAAAERWGFPLQLKIKDSIELSSRHHRQGLALVRIVEREDEAVSVAGVMIRNHELLRKMQRGRRLGNMEREAQTIKSNILKTEKDPMHDEAKVQRLKSALSQVQGDISKFKRETDSLTTEITVTPSSRAAHSIADYRGQPLWDPEMQRELMECDRATQVLRAAYSGDMSTISCLGISKELIDEHEGAAGRQKRPGMIQEELDRIKHLLDQMNEVETDDVEHHQKAAELQEEWNGLSNAHKVASTRREQSIVFMKQLREKLSKTATKPEPDAHQSRQVMEEEEEIDTAGLDEIPTPGQRRVEEERRKREIKDRRDAKLHPKCKTLTEQINAANNAHSKYVPLLTAAACPDDRCFERIIDTGAIFLTAAKLEETTSKRAELSNLQAQQRKYAAQLRELEDKTNNLTDRITKGEANLSSLRQQINALPNSDQTNRIRLNKQLNAQQRELREDRVSKVNHQHDMEEVAAEKVKQAQVVPLVAAALEILEAGLGDGAWNTPLHRACQMNNLPHVKALLEAGALPDAADIYGDTPLHMAVSYGHYECIKLFADIIDSDSFTRTLATHNMYGQRPIDMAQDPLCRIELRKAVLKVQRTIETPFMRIGLNTEEKSIVRAFSRTSSMRSNASDTFSRTASGAKDHAQISRAPSSGPAEAPSARAPAPSGGSAGNASGAGAAFARAPSHSDAPQEAAAPALRSAHWSSLQEPEVNEDIGDVVWAADLKRPKRCYPTSITPFTGLPYASPVVFEDEYEDAGSGGQDAER